MSREIKSRLKFFAVLAAVLVIAFAAAELFLRLCGLNLDCYARRENQTASVPDFMKPVNRLCGWGYRPGANIPPEYREIMHTGPDGLRISRPDFDKQGKYKAAFFGCSYTFAQGVPDAETMPYVLNTRCKDIVFDNYGVCAFGTYQCYIAMQHVLKNKHYDIAVYCFCTPQEDRTVDLRLLGDLHPSEMYCLAPYVSKDRPSGTWHFFDAESLQWPGQKKSVLIDFLHRVYLGRRLLQQRKAVKNGNSGDKVKLNHYRFEAMYMLADRMQELCGSTGTKFLVMSIDGGPKTDFLPMDAKELPAGRSWEFLHADHPDSRNPKYHVSPEDTHPNGIVQKYWADRFFEWLQLKGFVKRSRGREENAQ